MSAAVVVAAAAGSQSLNGAGPAVDTCQPEAEAEARLRYVVLVQWQLVETLDVRYERAPEDAY